MYVAFISPRRKVFAIPQLSPIKLQFKGLAFRRLQLAYFVSWDMAGFTSHANWLLHSDIPIDIWKYVQSNVQSWCHFGPLKGALDKPNIIPTSPYFFQKKVRIFIPFVVLASVKHWKYYIPCWLDTHHYAESAHTYRVSQKTNKETNKQKPFLCHRIQISISLERLFQSSPL